MSGRREQAVAGWGEPGAGPSLPDHVPALLRQWLDVSGAVVAPPVPVEEIALRPAAAVPRLQERLGGIVGASHVRDDRDARLLRAAGKSYLDLVALRSGRAGAAPDVVVAPGSHDELAAVLRACAEHGAAVVPFGGGTSVVGGVAALRGGFDAAVCLDLGRLDALLEVDPLARVARVQAGKRLPELDHELGRHGLRLGHLPQSYEWATVGGCAATRSAGQASTGFGRFDELVRDVRCATPAGDLSGRLAPWDGAGPELARVALGSEGALGAITELTLRLRPVAAASRYEGWMLRSFEAGCEALRALAQDGLAPDVARLADEDETRVTLALAGRGGPVRRRGGCLLIAGWEGEWGAVARRRRGAAGVLLRARSIPLGRGPGEAWRASRFTVPHLRDDLLDRGVLCETLETAAPWSVLGAVRDAVREALTRSLGRVIVACHVSHVYADAASLYFTVLAAQDRYDPAGQWLAAKRAATEALLAAGGALTHHHGVGRDHAAWLAAPPALLAVKRACDPQGVMNPGKLLSDRAAASR